MAIWRACVSLLVGPGPGDADQAGRAVAIDVVVAGRVAGVGVPLARPVIRDDVQDRDVTQVCTARAMVDLVIECEILVWCSTEPPPQLG